MAGFLPTLHFPTQRKTDFCQRKQEPDEHSLVWGYDVERQAPTCDRAVVVITRYPRQAHAPFSQVCQLQVTGPLGSFC